MVKWHNSGIINNSIDPSPQVWNISMAIFTRYMYSVTKVIMYNCHLDTQPGDLGPFKGCYSLTSTERSFSQRNEKRLETSKHPLNGGSGIFLFELIGINRGMIEKVERNLSPKINKSATDDRSANESHIKLRGERDVIRSRNPTEDKRAFRRMLTSADRYEKLFARTEIKLPHMRSSVSQSL